MSLVHWFQPGTTAIANTNDGIWAGSTASRSATAAYTFSTVASGSANRGLWPATAASETTAH